MISDESSYLPSQAACLPPGPWLVIAPHPDDETFGMGGSIKLATMAGTIVDLTVMTDGAKGGDAPDLASKRERETRQAARKLDCRNVSFLRQPDRALKASEYIITRVLEIIQAGNYSTIFFPSPVEPHPDHRTTTTIAWEALRKSHFSAQAISYEISIQAPCNLLIDISSTINEKILTMQLYGSQLSQNAYIERIRGLNASRAWSLPLEVTHAEAFYLWDPLDAPLAAQHSSIQSRLQNRRELPVVDALVSVIIRTVNRQTMLREAIRSVATQTYSSIEIILVNDGLEDLKSLLQEEFIGAIKYTQYLKNEGMNGRAQAANLGLSKVQGEYIVFLDDDDLLLPDHVQLLVDRLEAQPSAIAAYSGVNAVRLEGDREILLHRFNDDFDPIRLGYNNFMPIHSVLFRRKAIEYGCIFDESLDCYEDWHFWLQLARFGPFAHLNEITAKYRITSDSGVGLPTSTRNTTVDMQRFVEASRAVWSTEQLRHMCMFSNLRIELQKRNTELTTKMQLLENELQSVIHSRSWKLTRPLRITTENLRKFKKIHKLLLPGENNHEYRQSFARKIYHRVPLPDQIKKFLRAPVKRIISGNISKNFDSWIHKYDRLTKIDRLAIKTHISNFKEHPMFSVIMPVYNTPDKFLRKAIDSVRSQLYPYWELCIADDNSSLPHVRKILEYYAQIDSRIKVNYRKNNGHISASTNCALRLATGDYIALLDHDDELTEHALYWVATEIIKNPEVALIYSDEDKIDPLGRRSSPYFKPDWNPDLLLCQNYISHLGIYKKNIVEEIGGFRVGFEGSQDWDLALRFTKNLAPERIRHIPAVLYHWRIVTGSTAGNVDAKPYVVDAARKALVEHCGNNEKLVEFGEACNGVFHLPHFKPQNDPLVSIIIPTRNGFDDLKTCIESLDKTTYPNYEVIIIDNQSDEQRTLDYLRHVTQDSKFRILPYPHAFNYAAMHNWAVPQAKGEYICLLNNDTEIITPEWLEEMLGQAQRPCIGAVGAKLLYADNSLQHGGVITGIGGIASHSHKLYPSSEPGYFGRAALTQNFSAVTGACLLVSKEHWLQLCGMSLELPVAFNDVDFCLRLEEIGLRNVWLPQAVLYHHESKSRGSDVATEKIKRFALEHAYMQWRWGPRITQDPAYNPNLTLEHENFELAWPPRLNKPWKPHPRSVPIPYGIASLPTQFINVTHHQPIEGSFLVPIGLDDFQLIGLSILIGTSGGSSDGVLAIQLNDTKGRNIIKKQSLIGALDNMPLTFNFEESALSLADVTEFNFQITVGGNAQSVTLGAFSLNEQWGHHIAGYEKCALRIDLLITNE